MIICIYLLHSTCFRLGIKRKSHLHFCHNLIMDNKSPAFNIFRKYRYSYIQYISITTRIIHIKHNYIADMVNYLIINCSLAASCNYKVNTTGSCCCNILYYQFFTFIHFFSERSIIIYNNKNNRHILIACFKIRFISCTISFNKLCPSLRYYLFNYF